MTDGLECTGMLEFHLVPWGIKSIHACIYSHIHTSIYTFCASACGKPQFFWMMALLSVLSGSCRSYFTREPKDVCALWELREKCWCLDPILPSRPGSCALGSSLAESRLAFLLCLQWQVTASSPLSGMAELVWLQACLQNPPCWKPWHEKVFHWVSDTGRGLFCRILQVQDQSPPPKDLWDQSCYLKVLLNRAQTQERTWEEIARWGRGTERASRVPFCWCLGRAERHRMRLLWGLALNLFHVASMKSRHW